jgi:hypothetical protein
MPFIPFDPTRPRVKPLNNLKQPNVEYNANTRTKIIKKKAPKTQRRKLNNRKKTKRVSFNLSSNSIRKYYCPELQPNWINKIEQAEPISDFKIKKVPPITLKELFKD